MVNYLGAVSTDEKIKIERAKRTKQAQLAAAKKKQQNAAASKKAQKNKTTVSQKWAARTSHAPLPAESYNVTPINVPVNMEKAVYTEPLPRIIRAPIEVKTPEQVLATSVAKQIVAVTDTPIKAQQVAIAKAERELKRKVDAAHQKINKLPLGERKAAKDKVNRQTTVENQKINAMKVKGAGMQQAQVRKAAQPKPAPAFKSVPAIPGAPKYAAVTNTTIFKDTSTEAQLAKVAQANQKLANKQAQQKVKSGLLKTGTFTKTDFDMLQTKAQVRDNLNKLTPEQRNRLTLEAVKKKAVGNKEQMLEARYQKKVADAKVKVQNEKTKIAGEKQALAVDQARNAAMLNEFKCKCAQTNKPAEKSLYTERAKATVMQSQAAKQKFAQRQTDAVKIIKGEIENLKREKQKLMQELAEFKQQIVKKVGATPVSTSRQSVVKPELKKIAKKVLNLTTLTSIDNDGSDEGDKNYDMGYVFTADE